MVGLIVILVGVLFLLKNLGLIPYISWDIIWPLIVILVGVMLLEKRLWWGHRWNRWQGPENGTRAIGNPVLKKNNYWNRPAFNRSSTRKKRGRG